jgi:hypothetical protein
MYFYLIILYFLSLSQQENKKQHTVYIAKIEWHVGIIIKVNDASVEKISALDDFKEYNLVDIGWGDAEFYQSGEDFDLYLASKAILFPTNSVVRIQGYDFGIEQIMNWRDFVFEIELNDGQFDLLCGFIDASFSRNSEEKLIVESEKLSGRIKFYSSGHKYHLFNTCNTWVAEALEKAETGIENPDVITAEELFEELLKFAYPLKIDSTKS